MRFQITKRIAVGCHTDGLCWRFFTLPSRSVYYSGKMTWWSWWRLYVIIEQP
jgi:hypothetical protein